MGLVSDAFALARRQKWQPRPLRKEMKTSQPIVQRPAKELWETAARLPRDMQKDVKGFYFQLGKLDRRMIEMGLFVFKRRAQYVNYD